jgi:glycosyltransferase involved in cell wall biosynthesis
MSSPTPYFSIIIPTYNRAALVKQTVESALSQDFGSFEVIVVDDGSTDSTKETLAPFGNKIQLFFQDNKGPEEARNLGIRAAKGEYIVFLDSDDLLYHHALSVYHDTITKVPAALIIAMGAGFKDHPNGTSDRLHNPLEFIVYDDYLSKKRSVWLSTSFLIVNKQRLLDHNAFFRSGAVDDLDFLLRAGVMGPCVIIKQPATIGYRLHSSNSVNDIGNYIENLKHTIEREKHGEYPGGFTRKFDRLALIGGHVQCWARKGIHAGFYRESGELLLKGAWALVAIILKKAANYLSSVRKAGQSIPEK